MEHTFNWSKAVISYYPDQEKSKESKLNVNRPWYMHQEEERSEPELVLGQFVVQYDVHRSKEGEILVSLPHGWTIE